MLPSVPGRPIPTVKPIVTSSLRLSPPPPLLLAAADEDGDVTKSPAVELDSEIVFVELKVGLLGVLRADEDEVWVFTGVEDRGLLVETGYMVERSMGDGPEKVSLVG